MRNIWECAFLFFFILCSGMIWYIREHLVFRWVKCLRAVRKDCAQLLNKCAEKYRAYITPLNKRGGTTAHHTHTTPSSVQCCVTANALLLPFGNTFRLPRLILWRFWTEKTFVLALKEKFVSFKGYCALASAAHWHQLRTLEFDVLL